MKTTVIYHRADFDGIFCREIARKFLPADTDFVGWDYNDPKIPFPSEGMVYVLDLNPECFQFNTFPEFTVHLQDRLVWIDHHKSAIERWSPAIPGYRIDGVSACRLAWQWFISGPMGALPHKDAFVNRLVAEPLAVRLAGEYDVWDKRDERAELFQHGLRSVDLEPWWSTLLQMPSPENQNGENTVFALLTNGRHLQYARTRENESVIKEIGFTFQWEGLTFLGCNASRYNSHLFTAGLTPEHDGCFGFKWTGKEWSVSLYGVPGKPDIDLSEIAKKYGGGGHKQASGFRTKTLPFLRDAQTFDIGAAGSPSV